LTLDSPGELLDQTRRVVSEALETFKNTRDSGLD
jgi:hypothetical protein